MIFSQLKEADSQTVREWIMDSIPDLTVYQKEVIQDDDYNIIRGSEIYFYIQTEPQKVSFWWRLTIVFFPLVWLALFVTLPLNMLFTGQWGYSQKFNDRFIKPWWSRLHLM